MPIPAVHFLQDDQLSFCLKKRLWKVLSMDAYGLALPYIPCSWINCTLDRLLLKHQLQCHGHSLCPRLAPVRCQRDPGSSRILPQCGQPPVAWGQPGTSLQGEEQNTTFFSGLPCCVLLFFFFFGNNKNLLVTFEGWVKNQRGKTNGRNTAWGFIYFWPH